MGDCSHYNRNLYCPNAADCVFVHRDPTDILPPCPHYNRGFCPLGPRCSKSHVRRRLCRFYLAGFCPYGRACKEGIHDKFLEDKLLEKPTVRVEKSEEEKEKERERRREEAEREEERDWERRDRQGRDGGRRGGKRFGRRRGGY